MKLRILNSTFHQIGIETATCLKHMARIDFDIVNIFTEAIGISKAEAGLLGNSTGKMVTS